MKKSLIVVMSALTLAGCANSDVYSDNVYTPSQAKQAQSVTYGTVISIRGVKIQANENTEGMVGGLGGAVLGGILGSTVGGGIGQVLASATGAVAGGVVGKEIEDKVSQANAVELEVRKENGQHVIIVQKVSDTRFHVGQRVRLIGTDNNLSVAP